MKRACGPVWLCILCILWMWLCVSVTDSLTAGSAGAGPDLRLGELQKLTSVAVWTLSDTI